MRVEGCRAVGEYFDASPLPAMSQDDSREARTARGTLLGSGQSSACMLVCRVGCTQIWKVKCALSLFTHRRIGSGSTHPDAKLHGAIMHSYYTIETAIDNSYFVAISR